MDVMIREATAMIVRQNLGEILNEVQYRHDSVLITKGGKPVAALVDIGLFEKIRLMRTEFERMSSELATAYADVDQATAEAEIAEAVKVAKRS
jgi:prevent-host-death family protein